MVYFNFPLLLRKKMHVISLAPPCPSIRLQLPLLAQRGLDIYYTFILFFYLYCEMHYVCCVSNPVYLRRLNWSKICSTQASGRLVFKQNKNLNLTNIKISNHVSNLIKIRNISTLPLKTKTDVFLMAVTAAVNTMAF